MIETPLGYNETSIKTAFGNSHYLVEAIMGEVKEQGSLRSVIADCKRHSRLSTQVKERLNILLTHQPVGVVEFSGLERGKTKWWCGVVRLESSMRGKRPVWFLMLGWTNNHGSDAIVAKHGEVEKDLLPLYVERVEIKENTGYSSVACFENLVMDRSLTLPALPGLGKPPRIDWEKVAEEEKAGLSSSSLGAFVIHSEKTISGSSTFVATGPPKIGTFESTALPAVEEIPGVEELTERIIETIKEDHVKKHTSSRRESKAKKEKFEALEELMRMREEEAEW